METAYFASAIYVRSIYSNRATNVPNERRVHKTGVRVVPILIYEQDDAYEPAISRALDLEIRDLLSRISMTALAECASRLRDHLPCVVTPADLESLHRVMGNVNLHLELQFDNGVQWIARIKRQNATTQTKPVQNLIIGSEVAMYRFLNTALVPVPTVFSFCASADNTVGVPYILMEKILGRPYSRCEPNSQQKIKVMEQVADVYNELNQHHFDVMGSFHLDKPTPSHLSIRPLEFELLTDFNNWDGKTLGPFQNLQDY